MRWIKPENIQTDDSIGIAGSIGAKVFVIFFTVSSIGGFLWFYAGDATNYDYLVLVNAVVGIAYIAVPMKLRYKLQLNILFFSFVVILVSKQLYSNNLLT